MESKMPSTPHRRSNSAASNHQFNVDANTLPLDLVLGSSTAMEELSDGMATLDVNLQNLQMVHESLHNFTESFASFLHGMKMNAWCVELSEAPKQEHFGRERDLDEPVQPKKEEPKNVEEVDADATYMTNDSFVMHPPPRAPQRMASSSTVGSSVSSTGRSGIPKRSGIPQPRRTQTRQRPPVPSWR